VHSPRRDKLPPPWRLAAVGVFVAAGALFVTSSLDADGLDLRASSVSDLDTVVQQERARVDGLQQQVGSLAGEVDRLGQGVGDTGVDELRGQVEALRQPAGFAAVRGPGVTVVLEDAPEEVIDAAVAAEEVSADQLIVHQQDIQAVVNALWLGGAEAMTLQEQRVISTTGIKCVGNTVVLHGIPYAPPYVITALGDPTELIAALNSSEYIDGYRTYVEAYDLGYELTTRSNAVFPAYNGAAELQHASALPAEG
jgi:uncharacterized protein YlxW (UPF0749 family)